MSIVKKLQNYFWYYLLNSLCWSKAFLIFLFVYLTYTSFFIFFPTQHPLEKRKRKNYRERKGWKEFNDKSLIRSAVFKWRLVKNRNISVCSYFALLYSMIFLFLFYFCLLHFFFSNFFVIYWILNVRRKCRYAPWKSKSERKNRYWH